MTDYSKGKIYSIRSAQSEKVYIGSTVELLARRLLSHRNKYKKWQNGKHHYVTSFELLHYPDYYIELVEIFPCLCKEELTKREGEITRATPNYVNKRIEGRTNAEYREDNKQRIGHIAKQYRHDHAEHIQQQQQQYRENNTEKLKLQKKQYWQNNKEKLQQYHTQWREQNTKQTKQKDRQYREKKAEHLKEKHDCVCGGKYTNESIRKHEKTKKHTTYMTKPN